MIANRIIERLQKMDWILLVAVFVLFAFGVSAIYSVELSRDGSSFPFLSKHLIIFVVSLGSMFIVANMNFLQLRNFGRAIYIVGVILMVLVLIFGVTIRGTTGWFFIFGFSFQPVEFMKFALAVALARYFSEHARRRFGWKEIFGSGFLMAIPTGLTFMQPDLGSAVLLIGIWVVVLFFAGLRASHVAVLGTLAIIMVAFSWSFLFQDYQKDRVRVFLNPSLDPLVTGYNITQAKIAIGSGKIFGRGLGFGSQSQLKFLPESQTDFVFSVIAEELGFLGVLVIYVSYLVLFWRILLHSRHSRDNFSRFLAIAIFGAIFVQATVNLGVNLSIFPATGIALPFVSYGGSSLLFSFIMIGVVESMSINMRPGDREMSRWYN